jgi:hypothetical protein
MLSAVYKEGKRKVILVLNYASRHDEILIHTYAYLTSVLDGDKMLGFRSGRLTLGNRW